MSQRGARNEAHLEDDTLFELAAGLCREDEESVALVHLEGCDLCQRRLRLFAADRERVRASPAWIVGSEQDSARGSRVGVTWIAAALAVVSIAGFWFAQRADSVSQVESNPSRDEYSLHLGDEFRVMRSVYALASGEVTQQVDLTREVLESYESGEHAKALALIEDSPWGSSSAAVQLIRASCLQKSGRLPEAMSVLGALEIETLPQPARRQARWLEYLVLTDLKRRAEAKSVLVGLIDEKGDESDLARAEWKRLYGSMPDSSVINPAQ